jgi:hypothetical protein
MSDHWRSMFDNKYLGNWDLPRDRDVVVEIESVSAGELKSARGTDKKPIVKFVGKEKGLALNKTNAKIIAAMYGNHTRDWRGKLIALHVTQTSSPDGMVDCIRVRPKKPTRQQRRGPTTNEQSALPREDATPENEPELDQNHAPEGADDGP